MRFEDRLITESVFLHFRGTQEPHPSLRGLLEAWQDTDWDYVMAALMREGLAAIFYHYVVQDGAEDRIPPEVLSALRRVFLSNLKRNMTAIAQGKKVFIQLREAGVPLIVLKGLYLIEQIYPHPALRGLSDIDILIRKDDIFNVDACLTRLGYEAMDSTPEQVLENPPGYLASLDYIHGRHPGPHLHVHYHLVNTSVPAYMFAPLVDMELIWAKAVTARCADTEVYFLCPEHALIYLCEHALRVGHSFDRLVLVHDICLLLSTHRERIQWPVVREESRKLHLERFLVLSLSLVETIAGPLLQEEERNGLKDLYRLTGTDRLLAKRRFRGSSYLLYLSMNRSLPQMTRFVLRTLFPPVAVLFQRRYIRREHTVRLSIFLYASRILEIMDHLWSSITKHFYNRT